jgi:hypothetical protein
MDVIETGLDAMDWILLAHDRNQLRPLVNMAVKLLLSCTQYCWKILEELVN